MPRTKSSLTFNFGLLLLLLVAFKLTNVVSWDWFWILTPLWLPIAFFLGIVITAAFISALDGIWR